jgi:hypothetical protein
VTWCSLTDVASNTMACNAIMSLANCLGCLRVADDARALEDVQPGDAEAPSQEGQPENQLVAVIEVR